MDGDGQTPGAPNVPHLDAFCCTLASVSHWVERMLAAPVPFLMTDRAHNEWRERKKALRSDLERLIDACTRALNARIQDAARHCHDN